MEKTTAFPRQKALHVMQFGNGQTFYKWAPSVWHCVYDICARHSTVCLPVDLAIRNTSQSQSSHHQTASLSSVIRGASHERQERDTPATQTKAPQHKICEIRERNINRRDVLFLWYVRSRGAESTHTKRQRQHVTTIHSQTVIENYIKQESRLKRQATGWCLLLPFIWLWSRGWNIIRHGSLIWIAKYIRNSTQNLHPFAYPIYFSLFPSEQRSGRMLLRGSYRRRGAGGWS